MGKSWTNQRAIMEIIETSQKTYKIMETSWTEITENHGTIDILPDFDSKSGARPLAGERTG